MNSLLNIVTTHALSLVLAIVLALLIHEAGHYITARIFGEKLKFEFSVVKLKLKHIPPIHILRFLFLYPEYAGESNDFTEYKNAK